MFTGKRLVASQLLYCMGLHLIFEGFLKDSDAVYGRWRRVSYVFKSWLTRANRKSMQLSKNVHFWRHWWVFIQLSFITPATFAVLCRPLSKLGKSSPIFGFRVARDAFVFAAVVLVRKKFSLHKSGCFVFQPCQCMKCRGFLFSFSNLFFKEYKRDITKMCNTSSNRQEAADRLSGNCPKPSSVSVTWGFPR